MATAKARWFPEGKIQYGTLTNEDPYCPGQTVLIGEDNSTILPELLPEGTQVFPDDEKGFPQSLITGAHNAGYTLGEPPILPAD